MPEAENETDVPVATSPVGFRDAVTVGFWFAATTVTVPVIA